jgi:hypothetical protein
LGLIIPNSFHAMHLLRVYTLCCRNMDWRVHSLDFDPAKSNEKLRGTLWCFLHFVFISSVTIRSWDQRHLDIDSLNFYWEVVYQVDWPQGLWSYDP